MEDVMLDLETQSTSTTANILSIGAVKFNSATGEIGDTFYVNVDPTLGRSLGLVADKATLTWWKEQSQVAKDALRVNQKDIKTALAAFSEFLKGNVEYQLWGNGAAFDNAILRNAYAVCDMKAPWRFYHDLDYRTIKFLYHEAGGIDVNGIIKFEGVPHNALDDAIHQVNCFNYMYNFLKTKNFKNE